MWVYGGDRFFNNLHDMCYKSREARGVGGKTNPNQMPWVILKYILKYATPAVMFIPLVYNLVHISGKVKLWLFPV